MFWDEEDHAALGSVIEVSIEHAKREWRNEYARGVRIHDLMAERVRRITVDLQLYPAGNAHLTVFIAATKDYQSEPYFWRLREVSGKWTTS
jgi:hypothetical protein